MSRPMREWQLLADFLHTGTQSAGVIWAPPPSAGGGELESHEVAEVVYVEVIPPVTDLGVAEDLRMIRLVLDGKSPENYNLIPGNHTYLVTGEVAKMRHGKILALGRPVWNVEPGFRGLLQATCPKYRDSVSIEALAGGSITAPYRVRLWGYRYRAEELAAATAAIGGRLGGSGNIVDQATGRASVDFSRPELVISEDTWTQLPGGMDQPLPKIFHFIRLSFNSQATTVNRPYEFRFKDGFVAERYEDLMFEYDVEKKVVLIKGLGVRAPANLRETWIDVGGDERPKKHWPTTQYYNPRHFGQARPILDVDEYFTIPLLDDPVLVSNEKAVVKVLDNGTQVPAGAIAVIVNGLMVELT